MSTMPDLLAISYGLWAAAALGRAIYQYGFRHPPSFMPTHISAFVGLLYLLIIAGLRYHTPRAWSITLALLSIELAGVLIVGTIDLLWHPFPYATVWSGYGAGYLFMPLILPAAGLWWLLRPATRAMYGMKGAKQ